MSTAIYPGTFDPITYGHIDVIKKSLKNRTKMDKTRKNSPLVKVKDAILIRTDKLSKRSVLNKMSKYIENLN